MLRDEFKSKIIGKEKISTGRTIAQKVFTLQTEYNLPDDRICIDGFGVGVDVIQELAYA